MDRLTTLIDRFSLAVTPAAADGANLAVRLTEDGQACAILFLPRSLGVALDPTCQAFLAHVAFGGAANPLLASLPERIELALGAGDDLGPLVAMMREEVAAERCGATSVLNRLGEVMMVRLLRRLVETGASDPGVLSGLADPRVSRALVAIHDQPARAWRPADLADEAGLSRSQFSALFREKVGASPADYQRRWRLTLARQDLERGDRVDAIARRYGFGSADSFGRAFRRVYGAAPGSVRSAGP